MRPVDRDGDQVADDLDDDAIEFDPVAAGSIIDDECVTFSTRTWDVEWEVGEDATTRRGADPATAGRTRRGDGAGGHP